MTCMAFTDVICITQGESFEAQLTLDLGVSATVLSSEIDCYDYDDPTSQQLTFSVAGGTIVVSYLVTQMIFLLSASAASTLALTADKLSFDWIVTVQIGATTRVLRPLRGVMRVEKTITR